MSPNFRRDADQKYRQGEQAMLYSGRRTFLDLGTINERRITCWVSDIKAGGLVHRDVLRYRYERLVVDLDLLGVSTLPRAKNFLTVLVWASIGSRLHDTQYPRLQD